AWWAGREGVRRGLAEGRRRRQRELGQELLPDGDQGQADRPGTAAEDEQRERDAGGTVRFEGEPAPGAGCGLGRYLADKLDHGRSVAEVDSWPAGDLV